MHLCLKNLNCHKKSSHRPTKNSQRTLHYDSLELEFVNSLRNGIHIFRILNVQKFSFKFIGGLWILNNVALDEWEKVCGAGPGSGELSSAARVDLWLVRVPSVPASLGPGTLAWYRDTGGGELRARTEERLRDPGPTRGITSKCWHAFKLHILAIWENNKIVKQSKNLSFNWENRA